jgi:hypothetical protein
MVGIRVPAAEERARRARGQGMRGIGVGEQGGRARVLGSSEAGPGPPAVAPVMRRRGTGHPVRFPGHPSDRRSRRDDEQARVRDFGDDRWTCAISGNLCARRRKSAPAGRAGIESIGEQGSRARLEAGLNTPAAASSTRSRCARHAHPVTLSASPVASRPGMALRFPRSGHVVTRLSGS